jgi:hypothetical protein
MMMEINSDSVECLRAEKSFNESQCLLHLVGGFLPNRHWLFQRVGFKHRYSLHGFIKNRFACFGCFLCAPDEMMLQQC